MKIYADGDSLEAEIRSLLARRAASERERAAAAGAEPRFSLVFVAARAFKPGPSAEFVLVEGGPDAADDRIVELACAGDLAVTRDIPLAERLAEKGLRVLNDRGDVFTADNVRERRSLRDRAAELRALGLAPESQRGRAWGPRELKAFADAFDRELTMALRKSGKE
jgi:uncharacterized protein YaiI (UPF0178 family)